MGDYKKLAVWEKAHQLALATYKATRDFPKEGQLVISPKKSCMA